MAPRRRWLLVVAGSSALLLLLDYLTGPFIAFPVTFAIPVGLAAWHLGRYPAGAAAVVLVAGRLALTFEWGVPVLGPGVALVNAMINLSVLLSIAWLVELVRVQRARLAERVTTLEGLLPICSFCKKVRRDDGRWESIEVFVRARSRAEFSHTFCDDCGRRHYPDYFPPAGTGGST